MNSRLTWSTCLIKTIVKQGAQSSHKDMGFDTAQDAYPFVKRQVTMTLGIQATRGMARMRIDKLGYALAGHASNQAAAARRAQARARHREQINAYEARHCFYDI